MTNNKQMLLNMLLDNTNTYVSGQEIAAKLNVSRNAVWKLMEGLRNDGFEIEAVNKKGYRILSMPCKPHPCVIRYFLPEKHKNALVECKESTDSTNSDARAISAKTSDSAIICSSMQTMGRGRSGKSFYSPKDSGLYFSMILHPRVALEDCVCITTAAAVAVHDVLKKLTGKETQIKWVNDLFFDGKKICGILTESVVNFETMHVDAVIVGVGINLLNKGFPDELSSIAGALDCDPALCSRIAADVFSNLFELCEKLPDRSYMDVYRQNCFVLGKDITYKKNGCKYLATAIDVDDNGGLIVSQNDSTHTLTSGEVSIKI